MLRKKSSNSVILIAKVIVLSFALVATVWSIVKLKKNAEKPANNPLIHSLGGETPTSK